MAERAQIAPQPAQTRFLSSPADIAIYGGAAGGGKTWALLIEPLRHIKNGNFGAVIFRRTYPQITLEGGMWDESGKVYPLLGGKPNQNDLAWTFPAGMRISFAHMQYEHTKFNYQGAQIPLIGFDQLEHFTESQFFYMLSRNRSMCGVRPYVRGTCNPDPDSWLVEFLAWWIGEDGYPIPERAGALRWFVRQGDKMMWADTAGELLEKYPETLPKSLTFIPASVYDNKILLDADPGYLANLMALPYVENAQLLGGNWKIRPAAGKVFNRSWFSTVDAVPSGGVECRFWDFAATEKKTKGPDPDFTAWVAIRKVGGNWYVTDSQQVQQVDTDGLFTNTAQQDRARCKASGTHYMVRWEEEPGSAGKKETRRLARLLAGFDVGGVRPEGDKLTRSRALASQSQAGNVKLLAGAWNEEWLRHMHNIPDGAHDDIHDAGAGSFNALEGDRTMGSVSYRRGKRHAH